jgi:peptidyl-prolyl cis-trans isomerase C
MTHRFRNSILLATVLASTALLGACAKDKTGENAAAPAAGEAALPAGPVATVNGKAISPDLFDLFARSRMGKPAAELKPGQRQELLDRLIDLEVATQAAVRNGVDKETDNVARLALLRMSTLADLEVSRKLGDIRPTEQELRAEYETQVAEMPGVEYHASHILVATENFAQTLIEKIKGGANFADIARKESMDSSKENGGDLGWFSPAGMVPEFSAALAELKQGEFTSTPVQTEFGYHIIRLEDTRPTTPPEFEQVKDRMGPAVQQRKAKAYLDELKQGVKIEKKI